MSEDTKIWSNDPMVPYKSSKIGPMQSKHEIDGLLARWEIADVHWHWKPELNDVYVQFPLDEIIEGVKVHTVVRVNCPAIWAHKIRRKTEQIHWRISMRVMWWFIKSHLEMAYLLRSSKIAAFLPLIISSDQKTQLKDVIIPRLTAMQDILALPATQSVEG